MNAKKIIKNVGKALAFLIFLYGLITAILGLYNICRETFFQNNDLYKKLIKIDIGANNQYIDDLIGKPFLVRKLPEEIFNYETNEYEKTDLDNYMERIYTYDGFYLQTISGEDNEIIFYSITMKIKNFNPL